MNNHTTSSLLGSSTDIFGNLVCWYFEHQKKIRYLVTFEEAFSLVSYNNNAEMIELLGIKYDAMEWRLLIDYIYIYIYIYSLIKIQNAPSS